MLDDCSFCWAGQRGRHARIRPLTLESGGAARWHFEISADDSDDSSTEVSDSPCYPAFDEAGFCILGFHDWVLECDLGYIDSELLEAFL